ncbi:MAG: helix-turn-helix domain-containing protein [Candidatus Moraniibacteriota bacterium]
MHEKILQKVNLTPTQAEIMDYLLQTEESKASTIAEKIKKSRAIVYRDLEELVRLGLIEKKEKSNQITVFKAEHPSKLEKLMEQREKALKNDKKELENSLPDLISAYNLTHNRPGIKFYEGEEGVKKVLEDTLTSETDIYTIADSGSIKGGIEKINREYVKARKKKGIAKKLIVPESARKRFKETQDEYTEIRFLKEDYYNFKTGMQIYNNKISYQTLGPDNKIGVIIEDKNIYTMHKFLFEYIWDTLAS